MYSTFCTGMAAHGFIVYAIEHRDGSAASTRITQSPINDNQAQEKHHHEVKQNNTAGQENHTSEKEEYLHYESYTSDTPQLVAKRHMQVEQRVKEIELLIKHLRSSQKTSNSQGVEKSGILSEAQAVKGEGSSQIERVELEPDLDSIVISGHSFGAATALACALVLPPTTFRNIIFLDIWTQPIEQLYYTQRLTIPHLSIISQQFNDWESNLGDVRTIHRPTNSTSKVLLVKHSAHMQQSDFGLFWPRSMKKALGVIADPYMVMKANVHSAMVWLNQSGLVKYEHQMPVDDLITEIRIT
jgi:platelet-activating factor acetylhydrolase